MTSNNFLCDIIIFLAYLSYMLEVMLLISYIYDLIAL